MRNEGMQYADDCCWEALSYMLHTFKREAYVATLRHREKIRKLDDPEWFKFLFPDDYWMVRPVHVKARSWFGFEPRHPAHKTSKRPK
jgi:hypothetical protein